MLTLLVHVGVEFPFVPETGDVPLVCDISSNFLTEKVDVRKVRNQVTLICCGLFTSSVL